MDTPFAVHVVICQGPSCTERGQGLPARALRDALFAHGCQETVRVTRATCLNLCSMSPNCVVYGGDPTAGTPAGGAWYCGLTPATMRRVVDEHVVGGRPVADLLLRWDDVRVAP